MEVGWEVKMAEPAVGKSEDVSASAVSASMIEVITISVVLIADAHTELGGGRDGLA